MTQQEMITELEKIANDTSKMPKERDDARNEIYHLKINGENALVLEKHNVIKELMNHLHEAQFDRFTTTSEMLRELRGKIDEMILSDF